MTTDDLLRQWGNWARADSDMLGYTTMWPAIRRIDAYPVEASHEPIDITDDLALAIDRAVRQLWVQHEELGKTIYLSYVRRRTQRQLARILNCSRSKVAENLTAGVHWIDGRML